MKRYFLFIIVFFASAAVSAEDTLSNNKPLFIQSERTVSKDTLLPEIFLTGKTLGKRMLFSDDKDVFLAYIFLLKNFTGNADGRIKTNYKDLKGYLYPDLTTKKANEKILQILNILYKKYELIEFDRYLKDDPEIKLFNIKEGRLPYKYPNIDYLAIPESLWAFGWEKRLSFTGLYVYLINLMELKLIPFDSHWSIDPDMLALKYNLSLRQIQQGLEELLQYSLLEAIATDENNIFNNKPAVKYKILPLCSFENLEIKWKNLRSNNKKKDIAQASRYAALLYKKYDPDIVEEILKLMEQFPPKKLKQAFNALDKKPEVSKDRSLDYLRKVLNNI